MSRMKKVGFFGFLLAILVALTSVTQCSAESFRIKLEKEIGFSSYQQIVREKRAAALPEAQAESLQKLFAKLVQHSRRQDEIKFSLTVIEDPEVNAYALPGGYVFVNTGLLKFADTEGALAGTMAHEIAHIDLKHSMNAISRTLGFSMLLQIISAKTEQSTQMIQVSSLAAGLAQRGYSREAEYQADRLGVKYLTASGYSKQDLIVFFRKLESKYGSGNHFPFLQIINTHPPTNKRVQRIEQM